MIAWPSSKLGIDPSPHLCVVVVLLDDLEVLDQVLIYYLRLAGRNRYKLEAHAPYLLLLLCGHHVARLLLFIGIRIWQEVFQVCIESCLLYVQ